MAKKKHRGWGEGSITQRSNGRWRAQVHRDGKRVSFGADTKQECLEWLRKTLYQVDNGLDLEGGRIQLSEYLRQWLENAQPTLRPKTHYQYGRIIELHIIPQVGSLPLKALTPQRIEKLYADLQKNGKGVRTVRYVHGILHRSLAKAVLYGLIPANMAHGVSLPRYQHQEMRVLDADQIGRLLTAASCNRLEALFHLAAVTGMRQGELFGLKWTDVLWSMKRMHVQRQVQRVPKIGWSFLEPKTRAGRRMVPIGDGAIDALRRQKERQELERALAGDRWQEHGLVFATSVGTPMDAHNVRKDFVAVLREAGLPEVRFHDLRHSAASLMLNNNIPVLVVSKILGHANPSITLNTYGHLYTESVGVAGQLMDELVTPLRVEFVQPDVRVGAEESSKLHHIAPKKRA